MNEQLVAYKDNTHIPACILVFELVCCEIGGTSDRVEGGMDTMVVSQVNLQYHLFSRPRRLINPPEFFYSLTSLSDL